MKKYLEKDLQRDIIAFLELQKFVVIKINNVGIKKANGRYIPPRATGISDLVCCSPSGRFWALEIKIKPNKPTAEQNKFVQKVNLNLGVANVVYSLDEVMSLVEKYKDY